MGRKKYLLKCEFCGLDFFARKGTKCCSNSCATKYSYIKNYEKFFKSKEQNLNKRSSLFELIYFTRDEYHKDGYSVILCKTCGNTMKIGNCALKPSRAGIKLECLNCNTIVNEHEKKKRHEDYIKRIDDWKRIREKKESEKRFQKDNTVCNCKECGKEYLFKDGFTLSFCSEACKRKKCNNHKDRRLKKCSIVDGSITLKKVAERDSDICYLCGLFVDWSDFYKTDTTIICGDYYPSIEHVVPISKGGNHTWDNVRLAHRHCNVTKSADIY